MAFDEENKNNIVIRCTYKIIFVRLLFLYYPNQMNHFVFLSGNEHSGIFTFLNSPRFSSYYKPIWIFIYFFCIISGWVASCIIPFLCLIHLFSLLSCHILSSFFFCPFSLVILQSIWLFFLASFYSHSIVFPLFHVSFTMPFHTLAFYFYFCMYFMFVCTALHCIALVYTRSVTLFACIVSWRGARKRTHTNK